MPILVRPSPEYKQSYLAAIAEFQAEGSHWQIDYNHLTSDFPSFVRSLLDASDRPCPSKVLETIFWLVDEDVFVGRISIRHQLNNSLLQFGGHIGYEIRPSYRRRGYGKAILRLGLIEARIIGIHHALVTCDDTNIASAKIIEANGGVLENVIVLSGLPVPVRRYWVNISSEVKR